MNNLRAVVACERFEPIPYECARHQGADDKRGSWVVSVAMCFFWQSEEQKASRLEPLATTPLRHRASSTLCLDRRDSTRDCCRYIGCGGADGGGEGGGGGGRGEGGRDD